MLEVIRASLEDSKAILQCARDAYEDDEHSSEDDVQHDIEHNNYYKIVLDDIIIGGVFIVEEDAQTVSIEDFCIVPLHQNKGYGQLVLRELERIHGDIKKWKLTTPVDSVRNQHLYEKHGYKRVKVDDYGGTLCIYYEKFV